MPTVYLETTIPSYLTARGSNDLLLSAKLTELSLPNKAAADTAHISICVVNGVDFLLTWNSTHIANAAFRLMIESVCDSFGYGCPVICSPEELMER